MIENFVYNDIVLYAKGWYVKDGDIVKDLSYLFSKIYAYTPKTENEVAHYMLRVLDKLYTQQGIAFNDETRYGFAAFYGEIERDMHLYKVSFDMAIILYVKNILLRLDEKEIKLNPPHYGKKEYFRIGGGFPISTTYKEMNRIAEMVFNK